ncbi:MAG: T9SS type A sorting domain-containing protein [Flavobacteriaceae bacterium]|nr:T9SS type A sorting domain-containing protein [Flavobacteriaceae bacterium]
MRTLLLLILCIPIFSYAQITSNAPWLQAINENTRLEEMSFNTIVAHANTYFNAIDKDAKGSGYKAFKRWENYWKDFVKEDGFLPTQLELWNNWLEIQAHNQSRNAQVDDSNWNSLGPIDFLNRPSSIANIGRLNVITKDPNNSNILYAGAPAGGIWKTTDGGQSWVALIDHLPQIGVSGIAIDPNNSDIIYIATGDDDANHSFSVGVWKTTDGGTTWAQTGLNPNNTPNSMNEIYIHPANSNILWIATSSGIYKSTDGGLNWTNTQSGNFRDLKVKPNDPNTIYGVTSSEFYKSTDGGNSFTQITSGLPTNSGRLAIDITPADPNYIYVVSSTNSNTYQGIYRSTDSGNNFTATANTTDIFESTQAWYDLALAVSDTNADEIYVGVLNIWKSSNGGDSFTKLNNWYIKDAAYTHADIHFLRFYDNELYVGSDGGFFKSNNGGTTFTDYTEGMAISQFYRIDVSQQTSNKIAGGTQDNGGFGYFNQWNNYHGGDGMEGVIDPNNDNLYYGFMQFGGALFVSNDSGQSGSSSYNGPEQGNWVTPLAVNSEGEVYAGYSKLYRFNGSGWDQISSDFSSNIDYLEIDPNNPDLIYIGVNQQLHKSTDRGQNFTIVNTFNNNITSIEINNNDSDIVYVTASGFNTDVYKSSDGGNNFTTITGTLPSLQKNIIIHTKDDALNTLYLGTHAGVYYYNDSMVDWETFNNNLPNVAIRDLAINIPDATLVAGTFGRGIWKSPLAPSQLADNDISLLNITHPTAQNLICSDVIPQISIKNNGLNTINNATINYSINDGAEQTTTWNGTLNSEDTTQIDLPILTLDKGAYSLSVSVNITNDAIPNNNTASVSFFANDSGVVEVVNTFENADQELLNFNNNETSSLWEMGAPTGTVLNSTASGSQVYGTNLDGEYTNSTLAYLYSQCYDLNAITNPVLKMHLAFELEQDWDLFYVQYSTDLGDTWSLLGTANDPNWYNSDRINGDGVADNCYNCVGGQWTGTDATMQEYSYDLAALSNESTIVFRMVFHSDNYITEEGVILDNFYIDGTLSTSDFKLDQIAIYPNPSNNIFNIKLDQQNNTFSYILSDLSGKVILKRNNISETQHKLDMTSYSAGIYFIKINTKHASVTKKLILK